MECKHPYYHYVDGQLVCVQCGEPSPKAGKAEDKIDRTHETKQIIPPEARRVTPPTKKSKR